MRKNAPAEEHAGAPLVQSLIPARRHADGQPTPSNRETIMILDTSRPSADQLARLQQRFNGEPTAGPRAHPRRGANALYEYASMGRIRGNEDLQSGTGDADCFDELAEIAEPERWDSPDSHGRPGNRILRNYIRYTFERLHQQNGIGVNSAETHSAFNTGLATPSQQAIYGLFVPHHRQEGKWYFRGWRTRSDRELMQNFDVLPELATYTDNPADYIYDRSRELVVNVDHIIGDPGNLERFPAQIRSNPHLARIALAGAKDGAEARVRRNYKAAVPSWYPAHDELQLLLPLSMTAPEHVDLALVVSREGEFYRGHTVLTMEMAYNNARLLTRPDSDWLIPRDTEDAPA
jgi:hypothetical protein